MNTPKTITTANLLSHIPVGRENAVHMAELADKMGLDARTLRQRIYDARLEGAIIISCDKGYYLPDEESSTAASELRGFYKSRHKSGTGTLATLKGTREKLEEMGGE